MTIQPFGRGILCAAFLALLVPSSLAQLDDLMRVKAGRSRRVSSTNAKDPSNRDNIWVKPGETYVMADLTGPGIIRHIWLTFAEAGPSWLAKDGAAAPSEVVLRMYWDNAKEPAVEAPLGDFFAAGFGRRLAVRSTPIQVQGGDAYNSYFAMPFHTRARITVTNESSKPFAAFYYAIDWCEEPVPGDVAYFCAQYRREFPTVLDRDYLVLDAEGQGHFVGCVMSVRTRSPEWFGEGDDKISIDGESRPSLRGTGTEDYFLNAWGLEEATYPDFGVTLVDGDWGAVGQKFCAYRWHLSDPVRFSKSIKVEFEHMGWMSADETSTGKVEGFVEREDDFATVAFWYQIGQPKRFAPIPDLAGRTWPVIDRVFDGETLLREAKAEGANLSLQAGGEWTGKGQLFIDAAAAGAVIEIPFDVNVQERRRFVLAFTHSYDFGAYSVRLDDDVLAERLDLHSPEVRIREHHFGDRTLSVGRHVLRLECLGKDASSTGFKLGLDTLRLRERSTAKRPPR